MSLKAMVEASGGEIWCDRLTGDVREAADWLVARMRAAPAGRVLAFCGGETTVRLSGQGRGGRNQELALRVAAGMEGSSGPGRSCRAAPTGATGRRMPRAGWSMAARSGGSRRRAATGGRFWPTMTAIAPWGCRAIC
jgi:glycerate 2-kinase